jgi:hypothetical protein
MSFEISMFRGCRTWQVLTAVYTQTFLVLARLQTSAEFLSLLPACPRSRNYELKYSANLLKAPNPLRLEFLRQKLTQERYVYPISVNDYGVAWMVASAVRLYGKQIQLVGPIE